MAKVEVERRGATTVLTLNRLEVHNAIDAETAGLIQEAILSFAADEDARVLVVTGSGGRAFSSGADLADPGGLFVESAERVRSRCGSPASTRASPRSPRSRATAWPAVSSWRAGATSASPRRVRSSAW